MTAAYRVSPAADRDLDNQAAYLAREAGLETALRFFDAAASSFEQLARSPGMGKPFETGNARIEGIRVWRVEGFDSHLIFYRPANGAVEIIRVLHAARDIERSFVDFTGS